MSIIKEVLDFLETLGEEHKEKVSTLKVGIKEHSERFNSLEQGEREANSVKEQIGDYKISDLITNTQFIDSNGGVDKIVEWKGNDEATRAENERLKGEYLALQQQNDQKTAELQGKLDKANLFQRVLPKMESFNGVDLIWERESDNFAMVGDNLTYKGKLFDKEGREEISATYPYLVKSPNTGGNEAPNGNHPTPKVTQNTDYPE